jgi:hypothetical protein
MERLRASGLRQPLDDKGERQHPPAPDAGKSGRTPPRQAGPIGDFRLGSLGLDQAIDAPVLKRPVDVNRGQTERIGETPSVQAYAPTTGWSALGRTRKSSPFSEQQVSPA